MLWGCRGLEKTERAVCLGYMVGGAMELAWCDVAAAARVLRPNGSPADQNVGMDGSTVRLSISPSHGASNHA